MTLFPETQQLEEHEKIAVTVCEQCEAILSVPYGVCVTKQMLKLPGIHETTRIIHTRCSKCLQIPNKT